MSEAITLFDNGDTLCTLRARAPQAERLVVTFNCMNSNDVDQEGWGEDFLWGEGFDVLSVKARTNRWYQDVSLGDLSADVMKGLRYDEVFTYGTSMGAYAAAYFAGAVNAKRAILFSPQYSIDPALTAWDERWKDYWSIPFNHAPLAQAASSTTQYVIVCDPWCLDGRHAGEITAAVGLGNVLPINVPLSGHDTITTIYETGLLSKLVLALLRNSPEAPDVIRRISRSNKETWTYAYHLFFRAFSQKRRVANKLFALEVFRRANRLSHRIQSLEPLFAVKAWNEAADLIKGLGEVKRGEDLWVDGAIASVDASLQGLGDPRAQALLTPLWRQATGKTDEIVLGDHSAPGPANLVQYMTEPASPMNRAKLVRELGGIAMGRARSLKHWASSAFKPPAAGRG